MRLTDSVHLVAGGPFSGFGLTSSPDSHVYLVDGGSEIALIDCGLGLSESFGELEANITSAGFDPGDIGTVFVTHYHADHAGGVHLAAERFGARIAISKDAASVIEAGDEEASGLAAARDAGVFPTETSMSPTSVDARLADEDEMKVGDATIRFLATPGHCTGHGAYLLTGLGHDALFAGDAVFWAGRILLQAVPDCDLQASLESVRRLATLEFEAFLPGHGAITLRGGGVHPRSAQAEIDKLAVPKGII